MARAVVAARALSEENAWPLLLAALCQAGWNFVAQLRPWLLGPMAGLLWFGVDDASFSVHAPFHGA